MLNVPSLPPLPEHRRPALLLVECAAGTDQATRAGGVLWGPGTAFVCRIDGYSLAEIALADISGAVALAAALNVPLQITGLDSEGRLLLGNLAAAAHCAIYDPTTPSERLAP